MQERAGVFVQTGRLERFQFSLAPNHFVNAAAYGQTIRGPRNMLLHLPAHYSSEKRLGYVDVAGVRHQYKVARVTPKEKKKRGDCFGCFNKLKNRASC